MTAESSKIVRNASVVAGATLLSRVLGFVRDLIVAFALGAGLPADAFLWPFVFQTCCAGCSGKAL